MVLAPPEVEDARPLPRRGLERLDLLLLCTEALDYNGGEAMVWMSRHLGFAELFPNRVELWKRRCHNPLRRACRRGDLTSAETDALIRILCQMADRLYPMIRSLLSGSEAPEQNARHWMLFQSRLRELVQERMNPRRSAVQTLLDPEAGAARRRALVQTLALGAGHGGFERLKASLMDAGG
ncbi:MAG: DUF3038 domain-containing protein [Synechococcaceae cyanobacterium]|nr:DUF3038 domain-containing protein [Synechococcaceae cyanobacterium]